MKVRRPSLVAWPASLLLAVGLLSLLALPDPTLTAQGLTIALALAVATLALALRCLFVGVDIRADTVTVRSLLWSRRVPITAVAGLGVEPVLRRRWARLVVVTADGGTIASPFAAWRMRTDALQQAVQRAATALAAPGAGTPPAVEVAERCGRLEHSAAFTVLLPDGALVAVPALVPAVGVTPATVHPVADAAPRSYLGRETAAMAVAFVLPATVAAVAVFAQHVARVSSLDEFELPLPGHLTASLFLMIALYVSTAALLPLALVLLTRTGSPPRALGLTRHALRLDALPGVGLLVVAWLTGLVVLLPFSALLNNGGLSNSQHNTHVPAYFVVYALVVSAVTAVNEEVIVNGYLITRFAQLGWQPWPSLVVSLALRTSYHAYYGLALLATVPFGFFATRSFQKHGRLGRAIVAHFLNDAVILTAAVLAS